jgi:hypothetical protein
MVTASTLLDSAASPLRLIAAVLTASLVGAGDVRATGLVLHLPMDDGAGSAIAADVSGNGHDGSLINMDPNSDWVSGQAGLALDFDGTNDYVSVPDHPDLDFGAGDFSIAYWAFKRSSTMNYDNSYAVSKWSTGATPGINEWHLSVGSGLATGDTPSFAVEIDTTRYKVIDPQSISLNEWHHIVGVRKGQTISIYVDGVLVDQDDSLAAGGAINNAGRELRVAANQPVAPIYFTDANFDDVQIYDFALADGDVAVGQTADGDITFLYANPGLTVVVFSDGFKSGDTSAWSGTAP